MIEPLRDPQSFEEMIDRIAYGEPGTPARAARNAVIAAHQATIDAMGLDELDRYHDALLSCIEVFGRTAHYRDEEARVAARLKAAGRATG